ncbi:hypothetical protein MASRES_GEN12914_20350 [Acinetobacter baumannii]
MQDPTHVNPAFIALPYTAAISQPIDERITLCITVPHTNNDIQLKWQTSEIPALGRITQGTCNMIRIDEIWLSTQPMDMRAGMDTTMAQVVRAFGYIKPHCTYLFCNKRGHRMKVLVHDGLGIWLCARRLEQGKFHWAQVHQGETVALSPEQLQALIQGLPWQRIGRQQVVTML